MRLLGLFAVLISTGIMGFYIGDKYLSVLKGIKRVDRLIGNLVLGLQSEHLSLSEIFEHSVGNEDLSTENFIKNLSLKDLKDSAKIAKEYGFCTDKAALDILTEAFFILGKYSANEQINELNLCRNKLRTLYNKKEGEILSKVKLSRYSGTLAGIFIFILLL